MAAFDRDQFKATSNHYHTYIVTAFQDLYNIYGTSFIFISRF